MALTSYDDWLNAIDDGVDAQALAAANFDFSVTPPSDPQLTADVTAAKNTAIANGNTKLANTLNTILTYGDKVLSILSKNGVIKNQNLLSGYSGNISSLLGTTSTTTGTTTTDTTNKAPDASSRVFNIDFSDPKTLIIVFGLLLLLFYFLFFNPSSKHGKR